MKSPPGIWETHYQRSYVPFTPLETVTNLQSIPAGLSSTVSAEYRAKSEERRLRRPVPRMPLEPRSRSEGPSRPVYNRTKGKRTLNTMNTFYDDPTAAGKVTRKVSTSIQPIILSCPVKQPHSDTCQVTTDTVDCNADTAAPADATMSQSNCSNGSTDTTVTVTSIEHIDDTVNEKILKSSSDENRVSENVSPTGHSNEQCCSENVSDTCASVKLRKKSEYKAKFRPFSAYVYLPGDGFKKRKNLCNGEYDRAKEWYHEVTDRSLKAFELQKASQSGHPIVGDGRLDEIYSKDVLAGPWAHVKDRSLDALSLATVQLRIQEKRRERQDEQLKKQHSQSLTNRTASPGRSSKSKSSAGHTGTVSPLGKVWIRAQQKNSDDTAVKATAAAATADAPSPRPASLTGSTRSSQHESLIAEAAAKAAAATAANQSHRATGGTVKVTDIKTPEEATGIKSPEPESWTVEIEPENALIWTNGKKNFTKQLNDVDRRVVKKVTPENHQQHRETFERSDSAENSAASTTASTDSSFLNQSSSCDASSTPKGHSKARQKASVVIEKTRKRLNNLWTKK